MLVTPKLPANSQPSCDQITSKAHHKCFQQRYQCYDYVWPRIVWDHVFTEGRRTSSAHLSFGSRSKIDSQLAQLRLPSSQISFRISRDTAKEQCCPAYCQMDEENLIHMLACNNTHATRFRLEASNKPRKGLCSFPGGSTLLRTINIMVTIPHTWSTQIFKVSTPLSNLQWAVNQAIASRYRMGWEHIFCGIVSLSWGSSISDTEPA